MPAPPTFQRAPRLYPELPKGEVEITAPPAAPSVPSVPLISVLLPAAMTLLGVGVMIAIGLSQSSGSTLGLSIAISLPMMLASYLVSFINYTTQRNTYRKAVRQREERYRAFLEARRQELTSLRDQQRAALCQADPGPEECRGRVERLDRRLWERAPQDADFLSLRVGLGERPFLVTVKLPKHDPVAEPDRLLEAAQSLKKDFIQVSQVPICLPLRLVGVAGLAGWRDAVLNVARALAIQIAAHHSPEEVKIVALYPAAEAEEWDWLRWLPHTWTEDHSHRYLAQEKDAAHRLLTSLHDLLNRRLQAQRDRDAAPVFLPCFVFFLTDPRLVEGEPIVRLLLTQGPAIGAFSIILADRGDALPMGCQAVVELAPGQAQLVQMSQQTPPVSLDADTVSRTQAHRFAQAIAPIRLQRIARPTEIPAMVTLLGLLGVGAVEDLDVLNRWWINDPSRSLAVPIGLQIGGEPLFLDLHEKGQGPHGLVAGMTRSGKTAFLSAFIALFAACFRPDEVAFVAVDYKGGDLIRDLQDLPHLVGVITNLQGNLANRALQALRSEIQKRQQLFNQVGVGNIYDYQSRHRVGTAPVPLPHLVIISDEFAELVKEQPDFIQELVSTARVGGSLGIHLILATQQPSGVVNDQVWGNARFRICFKFGRDEDSKAVLKRPDAAAIMQPGRAYLQVGENEVFELFQAAWGGAPYTPGGFVVNDPHEIVEVALDGSRRSLGLSPKPLQIQSAGTQLQALVAYLRDVARREGIGRLPGPWLPPLPERVTLEEVRAMPFPLAGGAGTKEGWDGHAWKPAQTWLEPAIGLLDDPAHQSQGPCRINLGKEGHLAIYGAPGTGKTNLVQTMVTALALAHSPQDVHFYLLDFGGRLLTLFSTLPHTGGVILSDEGERLNRLLQFLLREMEIRKERFAQAGVNTLVSYRSATSEPLPAIVVVLDNYTGFATTYPDAEDALAQIAREGGNLGIHLVVTANSPMLIKAKISGNITMALTLQLADRGEYSTAVGRTGGLEPAPILGRGLIKGNPPLEFQTALPAAGDTEAGRTARLKELIQQMSQAWNGKPRARPVPVLPDTVSLCDLSVSGDNWAPVPADGSLAVPVGLDVDDLEPLIVDLNDGPHFLITGPVQSGKTTFLQSWLLALAEHFPPQRLQFFLVDFRRAGLLPLARLPHVRASVENDDRLGQALADIAQLLRERRQALEEARQARGGILDERAWLADYPAIVMAIDDFDAFRDGIQVGTKERFEQIVRRERGLGFHVLLAGSCSDLNAAFDGPAKALKELQTGFLLGTCDHNDLQLLNLRLPMGEAGKPLPPGQGYYARRGRYRKLKAASCHVGAVTLADWIARIQQRPTA